MVPVRLEEVRCFSLVMGEASSASHNWVPPMNKTVGRVGVVKAVNYADGVILVQFYYAVRKGERGREGAGKKFSFL